MVRHGVSYYRNENNEQGKISIRNGSETKDFPANTSISHNFVIGVDFQDDEIWLATSKGVCRGEKVK